MVFELTQEGGASETIQTELHPFINRQTQTFL